MAMTRRSAILSSGFALAAHGAAEARPTALREDAVEKHLASLDRIVSETMKKTGAPGMSVAVVSRDRVVYLKGFGVRRAGGADPVDADTVFALASLSKPLATTVVAGLVGDKRVSWDDKIVRFLPDFAMSDPWISKEITLRDMFCHRSGLPDHAGDLLEDIGYGRDEILRRLRFIRPSGSFRASYAYTNFGFTAAAVAAARAVGRSWEELSSERLYRRIGMTSATSSNAEFTARVNRAFGHMRRDGRWVAGPQRQPDAQSPAGGASASARDMAAWVRLQLARGKFDGRDIIDAGALDETHRPQIATDPADPSKAAPTFYGLGWDISYNEHPLVRWGHSGAFSFGAAACVNILPELQLGVVALSNTSPVGAPEAVCRSFLDLVTAGKIQRDWLALFGGAFAQMSKPTYGFGADYSKPPADPRPPAALSDHAGTYQNELYGPLRITVDVNNMTLFVGPENTPYVMRHYDGEIFTFQPRGENAFGPSPVRFMFDDSHKLQGLRIDYFDENGQGVFLRA
ncbi:serine hydrolase [Methylocystis parvus]|uniref:Serine hydrolase n=1 Tax=Methylocystis parvus TaxID=134 RepID=A0A6B8M8L9_9HYPH|nr:serine hydrolase [Methylocystis parvus]QGM98745.1 serine hydrolase [Methylocystis parvus]WBK00903.1 serine hydrolase [Methylocystis parvus OBBP]